MFVTVWVHCSLNVYDDCSLDECIDHNNIDHIYHDNIEHHHTHWTEWNLSARLVLPRLRRRKHREQVCECELWQHVRRQQRGLQKQERQGRVVLSRMRQSQSQQILLHRQRLLKQSGRQLRVEVCVETRHSKSIRLF